MIFLAIVFWMSVGLVVYAYLGYPQFAIDQLDKGLKAQPNDEMAKQLRDEMQAKLPNPTVPAAPSTSPPSS